MTLKARFSAGWSFGPHIFKMLGDINFFEYLGHTDFGLVTDKACCSVLGDVQIDVGQEVAIPLLGWVDLRIGHVGSFACLSHMLAARSVAMHAVDCPVQRFGPLLFHVDVTLKACGIRVQHARFCRNLVQCIGTVQTTLAKTLGNQLTAREQKTRAADEDQYE